MRLAGMARRRVNLLANLTQMRISGWHRWTMFPGRIPKAASKKVPEEDHSSSMDENSDADYEQATLCQQEVDNEVSKLLESDPEEAIEEEKPMRKNFKLAIKGMYSSSSSLFIDRA